MIRPAHVALGKAFAAGLASPLDGVGHMQG